MVKSKKTNNVEKSIGHQLVPEHILLNEEQAKELLEKYNITKDNLPKIKKKDPALTIFNIKAEEGDVILIKRKEETGAYDYYRVVVK